MTIKYLKEKLEGLFSIQPDFQEIYYMEKRIDLDRENFERTSDMKFENLVLVSIYIFLTNSGLKSCTQSMHHTEVDI